MTLPMSYPEYTERMNRYNSGEYIQSAFDNLNADQREFIHTGISIWK